MKIHLLIGGSITALLVIFYFSFSLSKTNENRITKIENQILNIEKYLNIIEEDRILIEWNRMIHKYLQLPLDNHYGSHAIVLLAALYATKSGPILELGMGTTSTPLLHRLALEQKRFLLSADSDLRWINHFSSFAENNTFHQLKYVEIKSEMGIEWASSNLAYYKNWTVVFIDHRPGPRRQFDLMGYSHRSDIVILHDTERSSLYQYTQGLSLYRYQYRFTKLKTYTDALSSKNETVIQLIRHLLEATPDYYFSNRTLNENF
ncbi:unnamed protein product [Rotaria sp. Silwood1]|nr:unnamed protein product [Rotaria sp. Silwood1]CAF3491916.1 unnamed protein product [Rotaria sp. Silwood1]CAF3539140.1 unnamed protein product [Rotaria sp. Silwood1]CAF4866933.1 unnamed protein product [Rotaria sp. Silwood1]CAF4930779.1 unnamed protein product [Rotaria sp. Silwood1]